MLINKHLQDTSSEKSTMQNSVYNVTCCVTRKRKFIFIFTSPWIKEIREHTRETKNTSYIWETVLSSDRWKRDRWGTHPFSYWPREAITLSKKNKTQGAHQASKKVSQAPVPGGRCGAETSASWQAVSARSHSAPSACPHPWRGCPFVPKVSKGLSSPYTNF